MKKWSQWGPDPHQVPLKVPVRVRKTFTASSRSQWASPDLHCQLSITRGKVISDMGLSCFAIDMFVDGSLGLFSKNICVNQPPVMRKARTRPAVVWTETIGPKSLKSGSKPSFFKIDGFTVSMSAYQPERLMVTVVIGCDLYTLTQKLIASIWRFPEMGCNPKPSIFKIFPHLRGEGC